MAELDRGPLEYLAIDALRPFPERPSFTSLVADELGGLAGADARLGQAHNDLSESAGDVNDGFDGEFADAVSDGFEMPGATATLDMAEHIETGDNVDTVRQSVQDKLPPAEAPIDETFDAPPGPPPSGGGETFHKDEQESGGDFIS